MVFNFLIVRAATGPTNQELLNSVVHLDVEDTSEKLLTPIIGPFSAWKPPIPFAIKNQRGASKDPLPELVPYGIRELA